MPRTSSIRPGPTALTLLLLTLSPLLGGCSSAPQASSIGGSTDAIAPPARICDHVELSRGPTTPPPGSVRVDPGSDLGAITQAQPPGTTFWLSPGTFTLEASEFGQVIPKDGDVFIGAPAAILDGRHVNLYAFTQQARGVTISHLTIENFGAAGGNADQGVVNHDGGTGWTVEYSTVQGNAGAGMFVGSQNALRHNCIRNNGQYGVSMYVNAPGTLNGITLDGNEIAGNNTDDWERRSPGCGCSGGAKFWDAHNVVVTGNSVHNNHGPGLWFDTNNYGVRIEGNDVSDNDGEGIFYEISYNASITNNTLSRNAIVKGKAFAANHDDFPIVAIYLSESGGDRRVNGGVYSTLTISGNRLVDNWGGVALWENADRFCGSPANTSSGFCTLGGAADVAHCRDPAAGGSIDVEPYKADCRWKTQNVSVVDNVFMIDKHAIGCDSTTCGRQSVLSNFGTFPPWSVYKGKAIEDAITFSQNNRFGGNRYIGDWRFSPRDSASLITFDAWRASPYGQDAGSTLNGSS